MFTTPGVKFLRAQIMWEREFAWTWFQVLTFRNYFVIAKRPNYVYSTTMIPVSTAKIGPFNYKIIYSEARFSDTHGVTCTSNKEIIIYRDNNLEAVRETLQHELLHALLEDICASVKDLEDPDKMEEQLIRLLSPRLLDFAQENQELVEFLWKKKKPRKPKKK